MTQENSSPFFIVGSPRSGTTLLQTLLDAHPSLAIPPESHVFDHFYDLASSYGNLNSKEACRLFVGDLLNDERIKRWNLDVSVDDFCGKLENPVTFRKILELLFRLYVKKEGKVRWGDKTPEHTLYLPAILDTFPDARFIHLVRDGRDVAESLSRMFFGPVTIDRKAELWRTYTEAFYRFRQTLPLDRFLEVRYEALVTNPEQETAKILAFLGEKQVPAGQSVPNTRLKQVYLNTDDGTHQSLSQPISDKKIGSFKQQLSPRKIEIFESIAGSMLTNYGYELVTTGEKIMRADEKILFGLLHQFRFFTKWGHWGYLKDRIQFRLRKWSRLLRGSRR